MTDPAHDTTRADFGSEFDRRLALHSPLAPPQQVRRGCYDSHKLAGMGPRVDSLLSLVIHCFICAMLDRHTKDCRS